MEFPDLGKNCSETTCKRLDFLPMKCDSCHKIFCKDHFPYNDHRCPESYKKDNQVPVCPLCNAPCPLKKGEAPDAVVGRHIDNDCQSDPAKGKRKANRNRCTMKGCKQKELIPFTCDKCRNNFCVRHRLEEDHSCQGFQGTGRGISNAGAAALARSGQSSSSKPTASTGSSGSSQGAKKPQQTLLSFIGNDLERERQQRQTSRTPAQSAQAIQGGLSEDAAMAQAIQASLASSQSQQPANPQSSAQRQQEAEDEALAHALQASEQEARRSQNNQQRNRTSSSSGKDKSCAVS